MRAKLRGILLLGVLASGLGLAQFDPALRLGRFHNLSKPGAIEVLVELPDNVTAQAADFQFIEDGRRTVHAVSMTPFRNSSWKAALILAVDVSRSLKVQELDEVKKAVTDFITQLKDPVALIAFADSADILAGFDASRAELGAAIAQLRPVGQRTRLYDALDKALGQLDNRAPTERQRIIVISDGSEESRAGADSIDGVLARAEKRRVVIDSIWVPTAAAGARNTLVRISERTDGFHADAKQSAEILVALKRVVDRVDKAAIVSFERKVDASGPTTKEVGIIVNRPGISSTSIPLQIAAAVQERGWYEYFQSFIGFISNIQTLLGLLGGAAAIAGLYTASYLFVQKYHATHIHLFPINPIHPFTRSSSSNKAPTPSQSQVESIKAPKRGPRHTVVEHGLVTEPSPHGLVLQAVKGPFEGQTISVGTEQFRIGADSDNDLPITSDDFVSGRHAVIHASEGRWVLIDQGSRNGTLIDGSRVERGAAQILHSGQTIQVGTSEFRVILSKDAKANHAASSPEPIR